MRPDVHPAVVLGGPLTVWGSLDPLDEGAREVDLAGMGEGELDDRADLGVDRRRTGLAACEGRAANGVLWGVRLIWRGSTWAH